MSSRSIPVLIRWRIRRRFHPLVRIGWAATRSSTTSTQTVAGLVLMVIGWQTKRSGRKTKIYSYTATPGETVRIRVMQGTTSLSDTTLET